MSSMVLVVEFGWQRAAQVIAEQTGEHAGLAPREEAGAAQIQFWGVPPTTKGICHRGGQEKREECGGRGTEPAGARGGRCGVQVNQQKAKSCRESGGNGPWVPPLRSQERGRLVGAAGQTWLFRFPEHSMTQGGGKGQHL